MIGSVLFLALQAAAPQQVALTAATEAAPQQQAPEAALEAAPAQPARKRVCRTVVDNRTGIMGKRSKVCRYVDEADAR